MDLNRNFYKSSKLVIQFNYIYFFFKFVNIFQNMGNYHQKYIYIFLSTIDIKKIYQIFDIEI